LISVEPLHEPIASHAEWLMGLIEPTGIRIIIAACWCLGLEEARANRIIVVEITSNTILASIFSLVGRKGVIAIIVRG